MKKLVLTVAGLVFLWSNQVWSQTFDATVNRNKIPEGETFLLTLELKNAQTDNTPDLSVLDKDFHTYSISHSYRTNIVNGKADMSQQWNLVLMPNKAGNLLLPAIKLDNFESQPITIEVSKAGSELNIPDEKNGKATQINKFSMRGQIDNKTPYVQEQIIYTLKLIDRGGLQGEEPYFEMSDNNDWIIKSLGAPIVNSQVINGQTIRELVFKYAMFPQKSGKMTVPAAKFRGFYLTKDTRHDPFGRFFDDDVFLAGFGMADVFATKNPIFLSTKPFEIEVKPAIASNNGWWLPAQDVKLYAEFEPSKPNFKIGEAVTRTIYLQAAGVIDAQLPEIKFTQAAGIKQYPEKPETMMKVQDGKVISTQKTANVYIPEKSGEITLPAIIVPWFNIKTNKMETARIPEQKIFVNGSTTAQKIISEVVAPQQEETVEQTEVVESLPQNKIYLLVATAFILGILLSYIIMKVLGTNKNFAQNNKINPLHEIRSAAKNKDLRKLRDAILLWAKNRYPEAKIFSLNDVEDIVASQALSCELEKLNEALYANKDADWNTEQFLKVFEKVNRAKIRKKNVEELLPKLYK